VRCMYLCRLVGCRFGPDGDTVLLSANIHDYPADLLALVERLADGGQHLPYTFEQRDLLSKDYQSTDHSNNSPKSNTICKLARDISHGHAGRVNRLRSA